MHNSIKRATNTTPIERHLKKIKSMASLSHRPVEAVVNIPVFMLPHNDLSSIPEESEVYQGFYVRMSLKPHRARRFAGLMSLSNLDKRAMDRMATTQLEFRSFYRSDLAQAV
jgi:hypothetical protein